MHNICVRIYLMLCQRSICDGPLIELTLVSSGLYPRVITSKTDSNVNRTSLYVRTVYHIQWTLHRCQYGDKYEAMPLNINTIHKNTIGLHEVTPLSIKSICGNTKDHCQYPKIDKSNCEKAH